MEIDIEKIRKITEEKYPLVQTDKIGNNYYISYNMQQDCRREGFIEAIKWLMSQGETIETIVRKDDSSNDDFDGPLSSPVIKCECKNFKPGDEVVVQIRKK